MDVNPVIALGAVIVIVVVAALVQRRGPEARDARRRNRR